MIPAQAVYCLRCGSTRHIGNGGPYGLLMCFRCGTTRFTSDRQRAPYWHLLWSLTLAETQGDVDEDMEQFGRLVGLPLPSYDYGRAEWRDWILAQGLDEKDIGIFGAEVAELVKRLGTR